MAGDPANDVSGEVRPGLAAPAEPLPSGTVTFLMTDIEGSTRLWEQHPKPMAAALEAHDAVLRQAIAGRGGQIIKTTGDGVLAVFPRPGAALASAADAQRLLARHAWGDIDALRVRMAVHTGSAESRDGDYFGPALNRVSRLLGIANGGQILVSEVAAGLARDAGTTPGELVDRGEHRLRDLDRPEHVFQLIVADLPAELSTLRSLSSFRTNLTPQLTSFVGRDRELAEVRSLAERHRLVTLIGVGGTGKTRLMLQVGADLLDRHPDGVWLVELASVMDPALIATEMSRALGAAEEPRRAPLDALIEFLRSRSLLLLLDNCEHVIGAAADLVERLLETSPGLAVIATSREALSASGEIVYQVPSLDVPPRDASPEEHGQKDDAWLEDVRRSEAVRLFAERALTASPSFAVTAENADSVVEICRRLDGIPLAIELAAARVRVLSVQEIASHLGDRFRLLTGGRRTAVPRQQTLQALIDWSWDLLSDPERTLLARLSVFSGGATLEAAAAVAAAGEDFGPTDDVATEGTDGRLLDTLDVLTRLVDRSLVVVDHGEPSRYRMLETIRQYARERLTESGEATALHERHLAYFLSLAQQAAPALVGPESIAWLNRLDADIENIRAALEWAFESDPERALRLCVALVSYWKQRGMRPGASAWGVASESVDVLRRAVDAAHALPPWAPESRRDRLLLVSRVLAGAAWAQATWGSAPVGLEWADEAVALAREADDPAALSEALGALNLVSIFSGAPNLRDMAAEASRAAEMAQDWWLFTMIEAGWAVREAVDGDIAAAEARLDRVAAAASRTGNPFVLAFTALNRGRVYGLAKRLAEARPWFDTAISAYEEMDDHRFVIITKSDLAHALRQNGAIDEAEAKYAETIPAWQHLGNRGAIANQLECFALIAIERDRPAHAARLFGAAEAIREAADARMVEYERLEYEAALERLRERLDEADLRSAWTEARALSIEDAVRLALSGSMRDRNDDA